MFGFLPTGVSAIIHEFVGWAPASSPTSQPKRYTLPPGKSMVYIMAIGSGAAGGGGGNSTGTGGGAGGGSGAISSIMIPRHFLPDTLILQVCQGGLASTSRQASGAVGGETRVYIQTPSNIIGTTTGIIQAGGGSGGGSSTTTSGGSGGSGGSVFAAANFMYGGFVGIHSAVNGQAGSAGGAAGAAGANTNIVAPNLLTSGGAGGGGKGTTGLSSFNGGNIVRDGITIVSGGVGAIGSAAGHGGSILAESRILKKMFTGGSGGGSTDNTSPAGNGGAGGIGCGGGGGGSSVGTAGFGGNGGPGYLMIASF